MRCGSYRRDGTDLFRDLTEPAAHQATGPRLPWTASCSNGTTKDWGRWSPKRAPFVDALGMPYAKSSADPSSFYGTSTTSRVAYGIRALQVLLPVRPIGHRWELNFQLVFDFVVQVASDQKRLLRIRSTIRRQPLCGYCEGGRRLLWARCRIDPSLRLPPRHTPSHPAVERVDADQDFTPPPPPHARQTTCSVF